MNHLRNLTTRFVSIRFAGFGMARRQEGQTLVEYALILVLLAIVVVAVVATLGGRIKGVFSDVASSI
jgi:pilus assembly protein Flp/PilA